MTGGVVLAGGKGRRMGRPKAAVEVGGCTLAERAVDLVRARCDAEVVVVAPEALADAMPRGVRVVHDGGSGAMEALAAGLAAGDAEDVMVLACDLPLAGPLLDRLLAAGPPAVAAGQPLCGLYPRVVALAALDTIGRLGELPARVGATIVAAHGDELLNVNTPGDIPGVLGALARE